MSKQEPGRHVFSPAERVTVLYRETNATIFVSEMWIENGSLFVRFISEKLRADLSPLNLDACTLANGGKNFQDAQIRLLKGTPDRRVVESINREWVTA